MRPRSALALVAGGCQLPRPAPPKPPVLPAPGIPPPVFLPLEV